MRFVSYHLFVSYLVAFTILSPEKNCMKNKTVSAILIPFPKETNMSVKNSLTADSENNLATSFTTEWNCKVSSKKEAPKLKTEFNVRRGSKSKPTANNEKKQT